MSRPTIARELSRAEGGVAGGLGTYLETLDPDQPGPWASFLDRRILKTIVPACLRMRLYEMARSLAAELSLRTRADWPGRYCLLNIGGGTALDSLHALILLKAGRADALTGRSAVARVLDVDADGPAFGARALDALLQPGGPLSLARVSFERREYDRRRSNELMRAASTGREGDRALVLCSSEGGLLEYGTRKDVSANLAALRSLVPPVEAYVGSFMVDGELSRALKRRSRVTLVLRQLEVVQQVARDTGWEVGRYTLCGPLYGVVTLVRRDSPGVAGPEFYTHAAQPYTLRSSPPRSDARVLRERS